MCGLEDAVGRVERRVEELEGKKRGVKVRARGVQKGSGMVSSGEEGGEGEKEKEKEKLERGLALVRSSLLRCLGMRGSEPERCFPSVQNARRTPFAFPVALLSPLQNNQYVALTRRANSSR